MVGKWRVIMRKGYYIRWALKGHPGIQMTVRWNEAIRRYQVYANDGSMEIADLGTFGMRDKEGAIARAERWMQGFDVRKYLHS